ncbi:uncharacterized protein LOC133709102 [Rosa rugosa]|uniref:uncharacterized protein LOC133709102 n=1 Tax=Rosa rugosa TaxID=74645 RepID=UPI002B4004BF|nr:uncharacterized protein LOC133709102 [Rosa rugosa]
MTAYWIARQQILGHVLATSSAGDPFKELWNRLWKTKVPGKVHVCVWRACQNLLPTRDRLLTKGYEGKPVCLLCAHPLEAISHVFTKCLIVVELFSAAPFHLTTSLMLSMPFKEWMIEVALQLRPHVFEKLLMLIWSLWKNWNEALWENKSKPAAVLQCGAMAWLEDFHKARAPLNNMRNHVKQCWRPAEGNFVKLNVDGAYLPSMSHGDIGGIIRGPHGCFVAAFAHSIPHMCSAKQVELMAIREGLDLAVQMKLQHVIIESDCLAAIQDIAHNGESEFACIIDDILEAKNLLQTGLHLCLVSAIE